MIKHTRDINVPSSVPAETASVLRKIRSDTHDELAAIRFPYRDYIINGSFKYWMDNTGLSEGTGYRYAATLFKALGVGGSTIAVTRKLTAIGQTQVPTNSPYYITCTVPDSSGTSDRALIYTDLEDIRRYASKTQTLSIWMSSSSGSPTIAVETTRYYGNGGTPSTGETAANIKKVSISTEIKRYDFIIEWDSIEGKTLGTDPNSSRATIVIWFSAGSDFNLRTDSMGHQSVTANIYKVQLIDGDTYHEIPERGEQEELSLIGRYYEKSYPVDTMPGTTTAPGIICASFGDPSGYHLFSTLFRHEKRSTPSMTVYNPDTGHSWNINVMSAAFSGEATAALLAVNSVTAKYTSPFAVSAPARLFYHYVADNRF